VHARGGITLIDEIYLGLSYEEHFGHSALAMPGELGQSVISINSFSKYFNMTGWRLGWLVVPEALAPVIERIAQNLFICASTVAQHAALACFEPESLQEYERRRAEFKARRDYFIPELNRLGLTVPVMPDGAFYAYADCTAAAARLGVSGSWDFAFELMKRAHLAVTPGRDFGHAAPSNSCAFPPPTPWINCRRLWPGSRRCWHEPGRAGFQLAPAGLLGRHRCRRNSFLRELPEIF
jgi:aspartate/methionine/tyrosine aminotransferase